MRPFPCVHARSLKMLGHALHTAGVPQGQNVAYLGDLLLAVEVKSAQVGGDSYLLLI